MSNGSLTCTQEVRASIGRRLRDRRLGCQLTPSMVGNALGLHHQAIQAYERGEVTPSAEALRRLAKLYRVTTDYILFG